MATFAEGQDSGFQYAVVDYYYESYRSGNNWRTRAWVRLRFTSSSSWYNNRVHAVITINGQVALDQTIKGNTSSGGLGNYDSSWSGYVDVATNGGSIPVQFRVYDEQNTSSDWVNSDRTYYSEVSAPSAPSAPSSVSITTGAPDKTVTGSSSGASGGTNGVTGYLTWVEIEGVSGRKAEGSAGTSKNINLADIGISHGQRYRYCALAYSTVNGANYDSGVSYSGWATASFTAPGSPTSLIGIGAIAPDKNSTVSWSAPGSNGTNGIGGYQIELYVDGALKKTYWTNSSTRSVTLEISSYASHGSTVYYRVRAYTVGQSVNYYSAWSQSGTVTASFVAPSTPGAVSWSNTQPEPDKTVVASWGASTGGSNGVAGYQVYYRKNGGTWGQMDFRSVANITITLASWEINHGNTLEVAIRSYTIGKSVNYYSDWVYSNSITALFVAPNSPTNLSIVFDTEEPIPTSIMTCKWTIPTQVGSNGVSGYDVIGMLDGIQKTVLNPTTNSVSINMSNLSAVPDNKFSFQVRAYTIGQGTKYYSSYVTSVSITIVADKFIFVSVNNGAFVKYKMFFIYENGTVREIKKNMLKVI